MTAKRRLEDNIIKGLVMVVLFLFLSLKSCEARAETVTFHKAENGEMANRHALNAGELPGVFRFQRDVPPKYLITPIL